MGVPQTMEAFHSPVKASFGPTIASNYKLPVAFKNHLKEATIRRH